MTSHSTPDVDITPWGIGWTGWEEAGLAHRESLLALSNGHIGWRGSLDEGDPCGAAGSFVNGVFEEHPMPYAEDGYGYPEHGQTLISVPDGKIIRLLVDDEALDIRTGRLHEHEQFLDFQTGILSRRMRWTSPAGRTVEITSERLVSFTRRSVAAVRYEVTAVDGPAELTLLSEIVANVPTPEVHPDPRVMSALERPLEGVTHVVDGSTATLIHRTRRSGVAMAVTMDHRVTSTAPWESSTDASPDLARATVRTRLEPGDSIRLLKFVGHEAADAVAESALRDRAEAAVATAVEVGWEGLAREQREYLDEFWACADVRIEGSARLQQAARFSLFEVLQSAARADRRPIPGKGLTGSGYEGHAFWDAEAFVLPVLTYTVPAAAREALRWRHATLGHARDRAVQLHLAGAAFPWRTIDGRECSGYWPAGTVAFHINADIADAVVRYVRATGDGDFEREAGAELLIETARLWIALGRWDERAVFHIDGVTGPDEYTALVNDNVFTNLMAQKNLRAAVDVAQRHPDEARTLGVGAEEMAGWATAASSIHIPVDVRRRVHQQSAGFTDLQRWDFDGTSPDQYPLADHFPYFDLYRKQVVKQADLVLALQFAPEAFTPEETERAFAYYEPLTVRDSSLSASSQAVVAARIGHLPLAMAYLDEAARLDLDDLHANTDDGLHIAAVAGVWSALVCGFGGMREGAEGLSFAPRLSPPMTALSFGVRVTGRTLRVDVEPDAATYRLSEGPALSIRHFGETVVVDPGVACRRAIPAASDPGPAPSPPPGREPGSRLPNE
ncbi:glycoside hydrolase family 65 protein [Microbacterium flavescens]|uniref:glycoside hydrolase family 65 protein n=1 Tax=Microbacterium flavescens TaxID=69366 RepID=UPI001BDEBD0C|nr:glycosyl hydrolase family 65 protein [Microbacterium flavescens]BFF10545.1 glycosyl hydrolase family 65 protein [Microbacterium flavescens]